MNGPTIFCDKCTMSFRLEKPPPHCETTRCTDCDGPFWHCFPGKYTNGPMPPAKVGIDPDRLSEWAEDAA